MRKSFLSLHSIRRVSRSAAAVSAVWFATVAVATSSARAGSFFDLSASSSSGQNVSVAGSNLIDLTNNLLKTQNQFASLSGSTYNASLNYGGVANAIQFASNSTGTSVTLSLPTIGFSKTFTGTDKSDVEHQIRTYLEKNGASEYARFLGSLDKISPVATNDGNPQAAAEFFATEAFTHFGLEPTPLYDPRHAGQEQFSVTSAAGSFTTPGADGNYVTIDPSGITQFNRNVALEMSLPIEYRDTAGASTYIVGYEIGLPISIIPATGRDGVSWRVTPWGIAGASGSEDLVAGGVLAGGGGSNEVNLTLGDLTLGMGNQISYETGVPVSDGQYKFDTRVNQLILKNGGRLTWDPGRGFLVLDIGLTYTNLFDQAAVPEYWTPTAGVGVKFSRYCGLRVGYAGDFGHQYHNNGGELDFYLNY